ncbi:hypothetical protein [Comamonas sp.]|uniref:hypothetical protein n=1 Tax=Comamonas sp. TaxID=34028 RepID=UPI00289A602E|nr:hypothetical protein [Comamonas sp.]
MPNKPMAETLAEVLPREIERVTELIPIFEALPMGSIAVERLRTSINTARNAMGRRDLTAMLKAFADLKGYKA